MNKQLSDLSAHAETALWISIKDSEGRPRKVSDAPILYTGLLEKNLIGIEIEIESLTRQFKMSQEKGPGDRLGVIDGYKELDSGAGTEMSHLVA